MLRYVESRQTAGNRDRKMAGGLNAEGLFPLVGCPSPIARLSALGPRL
jgi:hypothetical protein